jgi:hypothetical protein
VVEARERLALEANLKVVGTPSPAFIPALAELLADLIIEKALAGEYGIPDVQSGTIPVTRVNRGHEEAGTRTPAMSGTAPQANADGEGAARGIVRLAKPRQGRRPSADHLAVKAKAR